MHKPQGCEKNSGTIRSTIRMLIPLNKQSEAIQILNSVRAQIQYAPGCISFRLYRGVEEVRAVMIEELWENDEEIGRHLKSDAYPPRSAGCRDGRRTTGNTV